MQRIYGNSKNSICIIHQTCIRSLIRSRGAVTDLAAAPAIAPAAKSETSLGTRARTAKGCFKSWDGVGSNSFCSLFSATETQAKLQRMPLPPLPPPVKPSRQSLVFFNSGWWWSEVSKRPQRDAFRLGTLRHESTAFSSTIVVNLNCKEA